ncbi:MAG: hypothetical protein ACE5H1_08755 [Thermodesulfobacteriota bacterium]
MNYTKGPYIWTKPWKDKPTLVIKAKKQGTFIAYIPDNPRGQYKRNAALLAAAPEMLAVLEKIKPLIDHQTFGIGMKKLDNVIKKAKGEA